MAAKETWENATDGYIVVATLDRKGDKSHEIVPAGRTVAIAYEDRVMNQDMAADETLDVFKNGSMVPVRLLDTSEDKAEIADNPNLKTEGDLREMFNLHWKQFDTEVASIGNKTTLLRLKQLAQDDDTGATVRQVNAIEGRLHELEPESAVDVTLAAYGSNALPKTGKQL